MRVPQANGPLRVVWTKRGKTQITTDLSAEEANRFTQERMRVNNKGVKRPYRRKPGTVAWREIRKYQVSPGAERIAALD